MIEAFGLMTMVESMADLVITEPVGYLESLALISRATIVMTDSGGIQEETTVLGIPCLTLRDNTERPVTITEGTNELVGSNPVVIVAKAEDIIQGKTKKGQVPALWDGKASARIVDVLVRVFG